MICTLPPDAETRAGQGFQAVDTSPHKFPRGYGDDRSGEDRLGSRRSGYFGGQSGWGGQSPYGGQPSTGQPYTDAYGGRGADYYIDFDRLLAAVRRQALVAAVCLALALVAGVAYVLTATKLYTASSQVVIDSRVLQVLNETTGSGMRFDDEVAMLSQIEIAQSRQNVEGVIDTLRAPDMYAKLPEGPLRYFVGLVAAGKLTDDGGDPREIAAALLSSRFAAQRIGRTSVLEFAYTAAHPVEAALVANTFAQTYIASQIETKYDASRQAGDWLLTRLDELKGQAQQAEVAVQQFRSDNNLAQADGRLVSDQQLSELSSQYVAAQAETAGARARYNRIRAILDAKDTSAVVEEALGSGIISDLRRRYLDATKQSNDLAARLGPEHDQVVRLENEKREYERLIFTELGRIAESYLSDMEVAEKRQAALEETLGSMLGENQDISKVLVQLRELERDAEVYRSLYETFLTRYEQSSQEQTLPVSEVRVISYAKAPTQPSAPKTLLVIALAGVIGIGAGVGIGAIREYRDRSIRSGEQVRRQLGLEFLGEVPLISARQLAAATQKAAADPRRKGMGGPVRIESPLLTWAAEHPMSAFAETLRAVRHAASRRRIGTAGARVVGFGSLAPGEGKTTMALNFATLVASTGARVLLIDTDFRNPATSRAIAAGVKVGFAEAIRGRLPLDEVVYQDQWTGICVLPINVSDPQMHSSELLSDPYVADALAVLDGEFDYIVLDLPPIGPIVDARILAPMIDVLALVVEWGRLPAGVIQAAVEAEWEVFERCAGVILNRVDARKNKLYTSYSSRSYLSNEYRKYYRD